MLPFYIFAALVGGGLLLLGLFGGDSEVGDATQVEPVAEVGGHGADWARALSIRTLSYTLAAFGLTGAGLTAVGTGSWSTLALSLGMAAVCGSAAGILFRWLMTAQGGFGESSQIYIGGIGKTEVRIPAQGRGRIQMLHRGRSLTLPAISMAGEIDRLEMVIVVDVVDGVAVVDRAPVELTQ